MATVAIRTVRRPNRRPGVPALARAQAVWDMTGGTPSASSRELAPSPCHPQDSLIRHRHRIFCARCGRNPLRSAG